MSHATMPLRSVHDGYYYAVIDGTRYDVRGVPGEHARETHQYEAWELYRVIGGRDEFLERAPTRSALRETLCELAGVQMVVVKAVVRPEPVPLDVMRRQDLADALGVALIQARQVALPLVHHALTIASREVVRLGAEIPATVPEALRDVLEPEDAHGQLRQLAVSLEIVRDQAVLVGSEVVKRAAVLALSAVALLCEQALDAMLVDERPGQIAMAWA